MTTVGKMILLCTTNAENVRPICDVDTAENHMSNTLLRPKSDHYQLQNTKTSVSQLSGGGEIRSVNEEDHID